MFCRCWNTSGSLYEGIITRSRTPSWFCSVLPCSTFWRPFWHLPCYDVFDVPGAIWYFFLPLSFLDFLDVLPRYVFLCCGLSCYLLLSTVDSRLDNIGSSSVGIFPGLLSLAFLARPSTFLILEIATRYLPRVLLDSCAWLVQRTGSCRVVST